MSVNEAGASPTTGATQPDVTLLGSKLTPPTLRNPPVLRQRLLAVLSSGVARTPVTLISGPAGSGKTVLVSSWLRSQFRAGAAAWLSLEDTDDDPATFWAYVAEALSSADVDLTGVSRPPAGEPVPASFTTALAARVLAGSRPVVLVLDNSDCLTDVEICRALDLLVRHAGTRLRLVLCARADPQLPLHQYRVHDLITEIRGDSLAFTAEEIQALLAGLGMPVTAEVAADLRVRSEGWAVGVRLAAAPLKQGTDPAQLIAALAEQDGSVAQYLFAEVLERQPAPVRRFLLRVSVTSELWPDLVEQLSPRSNGRRILGSLARANAFVEQSAEAPGGFRMHPLFREMLKAQLEYDHPRDVAPLHQICATWYAAAGRRHVAIGHAVQAGNWRLAASLAVDDLLVAAMLVHESDPCLRVLERMPRDLPGPEAAVIRVASSLAPRRSADPQDVELALAAAADPENRLALRVCAAVAALCGRARDGAGSDGLLHDADAAQRLVAQLPEQRSAERRELSAAVAVARSFALLRTDAPDSVLVAGLRAAVATSTAAHSSRLRSRMLGQLALFEALRGELRAAEELAEDASAVAGDRSVPRVERYPAGTAARAWLAMERYDHAEARRWVARTQEKAPDPEWFWVGPLIAVLQSRLLRLRHEFDAADDVLRPHVENRFLPRWVRAQVIGEAVRGRLAAGSLDAGLRLLDDSGDDGAGAALLRGTAAVLAGPPGTVAIPELDADLPPALAVEAEVLRSCAHLQAGAGGAAVDALLRALELAEPDQLRRPFFDSPPQVRRLLRGQPHVAQVAAWLNPSVGRSTGARTAREAQQPVAPAHEVLQALSERELEVLKHLAELLSTAEIAAAMFVSVNTVRTHIRSILRKLAVSRRNQAVRRGRELGLI